MLCEARICVLSKCIVLEGLRQQSGDKSNVIRILKEGACKRPPRIHRADLPNPLAVQ